MNARIRPINRAREPKPERKPLPTDNKGNIKPKLTKEDKLRIAKNKARQEQRRKRNLELAQARALAESLRSEALPELVIRKRRAISRPIIEDEIDVAQDKDERGYGEGETIPLKGRLTTQIRSAKPIIRSSSSRVETIRKVEPQKRIKLPDLVNNKIRIVVTNLNITDKSVKSAQRVLEALVKDSEISSAIQSFGNPEMALKSIERQVAAYFGLVALKR